jgi:hypothetical protein
MLMHADLLSRCLAWAPGFAAFCALATALLLLLLLEHLSSIFKRLSTLAAFVELMRQTYCHLSSPAAGQRG